MITIISGTNRSDSYTLSIAKMAKKFYDEKQIDSQIIDLSELQSDLFRPDIYGNAPEWFQPFQSKIINCDGILSITPEYNGSFPGALKYFIDVLKFPESLYQKPAGFIGVAAGYFGALRAIEQLEMIFQYRESHLYGKRVMFPSVSKALSETRDTIVDEKLKARFEKMLAGFNDFAIKLR